MCASRSLPSRGPIRSGPGLGLDFASWGLFSSQFLKPPFIRPHPPNPSFCSRTRYTVLGRSEAGGARRNCGGQGCARTRRRLLGSGICGWSGRSRCRVQRRSSRGGGRRGQCDATVWYWELQPHRVPRQLWRQPARWTGRGSSGGSSGVGDSTDSSSATRPPRTDAHSLCSCARGATRWRGDRHRCQSCRWGHRGRCRSVR